MDTTLSIRTLLFVLLVNLGFIASVTAKNTLYVTAKKGLIVRDQPSLRGKHLGKFPYGNEITVLERTEKIISIISNGEQLKGEWVKVSPIGVPFSLKQNLQEEYYVFSAFLSEKAFFQKDFVPSEEFRLTAIDETKTSENSNTSFAYVENSYYERRQEIQVLRDAYQEEFSRLTEISTPSLKNVRKVVKLEIEHCAEYCKTDVYYWLVTYDRRWVSLPKLENNMADLSTSKLAYRFTNNTSVIQLISYKESLVDYKNGEYAEGNIRRVYSDENSKLFWDGFRLVEDIWLTMEGN